MKQDIKISNFTIDVKTDSKSKIINRLKRLKTTMYIEDGGAYREDMSFSQINLGTTKTEDQLENWLYKTPGIEYVGFVER